MEVKCVCVCVCVKVCICVHANWQKGGVAEGVTCNKDTKLLKGFI